jgi:dipeptide/tripeptide permease
MRTFLRNNGLSLVLLAMFAGSFIGQTTSGRAQYNEERAQYGEAPVSLFVMSFVLHAVGGLVLQRAGIAKAATFAYRRSTT